MTTTSHSEISDPAVVRHVHVATQLARDLDAYFRAYRTTDGKNLTEGDVMSALGGLIGDHCKDADRVSVWCRSIQVSAMTTNATRGKMLK